MVPTVREWSCFVVSYVSREMVLDARALFFAALWQKTEVPAVCLIIHTTITLHVSGELRQQRYAV